MPESDATRKVNRPPDLFRWGRLLFLTELAPDAIRLPYRSSREVPVWLYKLYIVFGPKMRVGCLMFIMQPIACEKIYFMLHFLCCFTVTADVYKSTVDLTEHVYIPRGGKNEQNKMLSDL